MALIADTDVIREVGTIDLPLLADTLRAVGDSVVDTEDHWAKAFREDRAPTISMYEQTALRWSSACDNFDNLLRDAAVRIDRAADALVFIADNYENTDAVAAEGILSIHPEPS